MKCLVTGGTGFIGSNLAKELMKQGHEVIIIGRDPKYFFPEFEGKLIQPSMVGVDWDRIGKVDVVFHQAAITDNQFKDESEIYRVNVLSTRKVFEEMIKRGCKQFVYASSTAVYGNLKPPYKESMQPEPHNHYAKSKVACEKIAKELSEKHPDCVFVGLRYCNVYGPREGRKGRLATMIYHFAHQMQKGNPKMFEGDDEFGNGEQKRAYVYVKDVVKANILASKATKSFVVNCAGIGATSFNKLVEVLNKVLGLQRTPEYIPNPYKGNYQNWTECDLTLAKELLGFEPDFDIEKGIKDYFDSGELMKKY